MRLDKKYILFQFRNPFFLHQMILHPLGDWSGRIWARTGCRWNGAACETGDCGRSIQCDEYSATPPVSFAEFHFNLWEGQDYYDISIINGSNVPLSVSNFIFCYFLQSLQNQGQSIFQSSEEVFFNFLKSSENNHYMELKWC